MRILSIILFLSLLYSCAKSSGCTDTVQVKLRNLTGLDGCGWVLQKQDGSFLEAQNLSEFEIQMVEGKLLGVKVEEVDGGSICMVGTIVTIECLIEL